MLALTAALMASVAFAAPVSAGRITTGPLNVRPDPVGGAWIYFEGTHGQELARLHEDGAVSPVALPAPLRAGDLEVMPLKDGWTVVTARLWPGGAREARRCAPEGYSVPIQETHCGVLVVAQYGPDDRWTGVQRMAHSSGAGTESGDPEAAESGGRIELAWEANQGEGGVQPSPIAVAVARPGHRFGTVHIAQRVLPITPHSVEITSFRGTLYLSAMYGREIYDNRMVERRLYGNGQLGAPHYLQSELLYAPQSEAFPGPHGSEIRVFQLADEGEQVGLARRAGWAPRYQSKATLSGHPEAGFRVARSSNNRLLISVRNGFGPPWPHENVSVIAAVTSPAGHLGPTETVEYSPQMGTSGDYTWTGAINNAGQALLAVVDSAFENGIWLHPYAPDCGGFAPRIALTEDGAPATLSEPTGGATEGLNAVAGTNNVFHLVWVDSASFVQTTNLRVSCPQPSTGGPALDR